MLESSSAECFEIWPENRQTWNVFCSMRTQWLRSNGMSGDRYLGLNYVALESVMRMLKIRNQDEIFNGIRVMESAAMEVLNHE